MPSLCGDVCAWSKRLLLGPWLCAGLLVPGLALADGPASAPASMPAVVPSIGETLSREGVTDISQLSLSDLLNGQVVVATQTPTNQRETPGIVSVITREDIQASGARDLMDVLVLVPGFYFATDVEGVVSVGIRGAWGEEGKVLVLLDGVEMNERLYSNIAFGNHFPIDAIERIEIIRGPGSVIYGQFAELAVINIITRGPSDLHGAAATLTYGRMGSGAQLGHENLTLQYADEVPEVPGLTASATLFAGEAQRSDGTYFDYSNGPGAPSAYSMDGSSGLKPLLVDLGASYRGAHAHFLFDDYRVDNRDNYGAPIAGSTNAFRTYDYQLSYDLHVGDAWTIVPRFDLKTQQSWQDTDVTSPAYFDVTATKTLGNITAFYESGALSALAGVESFLDQAHVAGPKDVGFNYYFNGDTEPNTHYWDLAEFAEATYRTDLANVTAGARFEHYSGYSGSGLTGCSGAGCFIPRLAVTKLFQRFHYKLLYSWGFRPPVFENINANPAIQPELTRVYEAEVGYQLTDQMALSINAFDVAIHGAIIYAINPANSADEYYNSSRLSTRGVEATYVLKLARAYATATYSYYTAAALPGLGEIGDFGASQVAYYAVPGVSGPNLAFPQHKLAIYGSYRILPDLSVSPQLVWMSRRYWSAYYTSTPAPALEYGYFDPILLANLYVRYQDVGHIPGLTIGAGVFNLLDHTIAGPFSTYYEFPQAYAAGHPPLPGPSREILVRVGYERQL